MPTLGCVLGGKPPGFCVDRGPVARRCDQDAGTYICFDRLQIDRRHLWMKLLPEYRESNRVHKLEASKRRQGKRPTAGRSHVGCSPGGMHLLDVKAVKKAGISVRLQ